MLTVFVVLLAATLIVFAGEAVRGQCRRMLEPAAPASLPQVRRATLLLDPAVSAGSRYGSLE